MALPVEQLEIFPHFLWEVALGFFGSLGFGSLGFGFFEGARLCFALVYGSFEFSPRGQKGRTGKSTPSTVSSCTSWVQIAEKEEALPLLFFLPKRISVLKKLGQAKGKCRRFHKPTAFTGVRSSQSSFFLKAPPENGRPGCVRLRNHTPKGFLLKH